MSRPQSSGVGVRVVGDDLAGDSADLLDAPADDPLIGRVLDGRYRLDARIGAGGMGHVYRGVHLMMEHRVAIKLLRPEVADEPNAARRFAREAKSTSRLDHPSCVRVTDLGATDDGLMYLVMEYLDGRTVGQDLKHDGPMSADRVVHIARQVCDALQCAHDKGIVHRDLKPENIMLIQRGNDPDVVKVLDFGLAKMVDDSGGAFTALTMTPLTREGMVFGTPEYMSPEQAIDEKLSPQSDLYSLGVVMYEMLTGALPFQSEHYMEILAAHVREKPVAPHLLRPELAIPESLSGMVMWLMAKSPDERPMSAERVKNDLAPLQRPSRRARRVAEEVAASATLDIDAEAVVNASVATGPLTQGSQALPGESQAAISAAYYEPRPTPRRKQALLGALVGAVVLAVLLAVLLSGGDTPARDGASSPPGAKPEHSATRHAEQPVATPMAVKSLPVPPTEPKKKPASNSAETTKRPDVTDKPSREDRPEDRPEGRPNPRPKAQKRPSPEVENHLKAAEKARTAGNVLEQMAHADSALRLAPRNADAAYLLGDALLASDRKRGCRYLRRARRLEKARKAYAQAGCASID